MILLMNTSSFGQTTHRFKVQAQACEKLVTSEGSVLFIEADAFDTTSDTVEISYTEYRSVVDMVLHDIRMHMALGPDRLQLESTGMFSIEAHENGTPVKLKKNKRIAVQMALDTKPKWLTQAYQYNSTRQSWRMYNAEVRNMNVADDEELWRSTSVSVSDEVGAAWEDPEGWADPFGSEIDQADEELCKEIFQMMEIDEFGLYNYDRMIDGVSYEYVTPLFVDSQGKPINSMVYMVYEGINSVFYFPQYTWDAQFFTIVGVDYQLFTIVEGEVYVASGKPAATAKGVTYVLNKVKPETDLRATLTKLLAAL